MALRRGSVARVEARLAASVDVYRGRAVLSSSGADREVPALRRAEVVGPGEVTGTRPLTYDAADRRDRRYLAPAITLDRERDALDAALRAERADGSVLADRLRSEVADAPGQAVLRRLVAARDDGLDAAFAVAVVGSGEGRTFEQRWDRAMGFHDAGATWGLTAMDVDAEPEAVIDALSAAIDRSPVPSLPPEPDPAAAGQPTEATDPAAAAVEADAPTGDTETPPADAGGTTSAPAPAAPVAGPPASDGGAGGIDTSPLPPAPTVPVPTTLPTRVLPGVVDPVVDGVDDATGGTVTGLTGALDPVVEPLAPVVDPRRDDVIDPLLGTPGILTRP